MEKVNKRTNKEKKSPVVDHHCRECGAWDEVIDDKRPLCDTCLDNRTITDKYTVCENCGKKTKAKYECGYCGYDRQ